MIGAAGQFVYDYNCFRDAARRKFDILLQLGYTSSSVWHRLWPRDAVNIINMDGLEWRRDKYGPMTRKFLLRAEKWAARHADILVADSLSIQEYLQDKFRRSCVYIPYGAEMPQHYEKEKLSRWGLEQDGYFLLMARMEPENSIEIIIRGWLSSGSEKPLVLIGNPGNSFGLYLQKTYRNERLLFIGAIYQQEVVNTLRHYSSIYFHGHSVGGTNPSLLEAMACRCAIVAHDNSFNRAILGKEARYFHSEQDVAGLLQSLPDGEMVDGWKQVNAEKIRDQYTWNKIVERYQELFIKVYRDGKASESLIHSKELLIQEQGRRYHTNTKNGRTSGEVRRRCGYKTDG